MSTPCDTKFVAVLSSLARAIGASAVFVGSLVLIGWLFRLPGLNSMHGVLGGMGAHAAFCFVLTGAALSLSYKEHTRQWKLRLAQACALIVILASILTLGQSLLGLNLDIDQVLFNGAFGAVFPGRMPVATALTFLLFGIALLVLDAEVHGPRPAEVLAFGGALIALLAVVAYGYGFVSFFQIRDPRPLAFHTVLLMLVLSFGIHIARPKRGFMAIVTSTSSGGVMVRRLLPMAVGITVLVGWLVMEGERAGFYPSVLSVAFYSLSIVAIFSVLIRLTATTLHRIDVQRREAEEQIRKMNAELEQRVLTRTAQLEATNKELESFSYSVSHDLRAPLRHIDGFSRILQEGWSSKLDADAQNYLQRIRKGTLRMGLLIDDLLNLSRVGREEVTLQVTGLNSLVEEVLLDLSSETTGRSIEWRVGELPFADCDPALIKQVFWNLLSNAVKFTRPRTEAIIEIGQVTVNGGQAVFVRDNGVGFSMKYADKLFGTFQRLHRAEEFEGTGVGLATVQRIIHKHHGQIWAEAELDKGATFYFVLGKWESSEPSP